tara:strand:- start:1011 stop:1193 length:183 start_codon:yes stop_codon:yes gene_type:complete
MKEQLLKLNGETKSRIEIGFSGKWEAEFISPKSRIDLGSYDTKEEAIRVCNGIFNLTYTN